MADDVRARVVAVAVAHRRAVRVERLLLGRALGVDDELERLVLDAGSSRPRGAPAPGARPRRARPARRSSGRGRSRAPAGRGTRARSVFCARDVGVREHGVDAGHRERLGDVDRDDARVRVRAADRVAPEHPGRPEVARVGELAGRLRACRRRAGRPRRSGRPRAAGAPWSRPRSRAAPSRHPHPGWGRVRSPRHPTSTISRPGSRVRHGRVPIPYRFLHGRGRRALASVAHAPPPAGPRRRSSRSRCSGRGCRTAPRGSRPRSGSARAPEQVGGRDDEAGRAEAALDGARLDERLLHAVQRRRSPARPSTVTTSWPSACAASTRHAQTSVPSSSTEHEPHSPCSHAFFEPGRPSRSRSAKSRLSPGQTSASRGSPLTVSAILMPGTAPAPASARTRSAWRR